MSDMQEDGAAQAPVLAIEPGTLPAFLQETRALTRRWYLQTRREHTMITFGLIQPLLWLLLFGNMFAGVARWNPGAFGTDHYLAFQTAGVLALTVLGNAMMGGIPLLFDRETGMLSKILVTPSFRSSLIVSRFIFTSVFSLAQGALMLLVAYFMGVTVAGGLPGLLIIAWIAFLLSVGFTVLSMMLAFIFPGHAAFFAVTAFISQPMLFLSTALMPQNVMPGWMGFAVWLNPLTHAIEAIRNAMLGPGISGMLVLRSSCLLLLFDLFIIYKASRIIRRGLE